MRRTNGVALIAGAALFGLSLSPMAVAAPKKEKKLDLFWKHPDIASHGVRSVALLPAATFSHDLKAEKEIELAWVPHARGSGHRWFFSTMTKDMLRRSFGGDSVLAAVNKGVLKDVRVDSLSARALCRALRVSAVLSMRADQWEQIQMEWNQTGTPSTTVQMKAALVDSSGRLLWTASGSETGEGPLHQADSGTLGVKSSGLGLEAVTGQGGAPAFQEVLTPLFKRWIGDFPAGPAAPAPGASPGSGP
ncbi:MAG: hypothetical protein ACRENJ_06400 [Candidatus Eiseniibacteriota bacterium]